MLSAADLPDDIAALKAMLVASKARNLHKDERIGRLEKLVAAFGRKSEKREPVLDALIAELKRSTKPFMDETRAPVLDPGRRKTKTGYFWALARDDRPWGGGAPPGVAFSYAPGRGGSVPHAEPRGAGTTKTRWQRPLIRDRQIVKSSFV